MGIGAKMVPVPDLKDRLILYLKNVDINITHPTSGSVNLSLLKSGEIAEGVIKILKDFAGEPYNEGETEEYTFGGKGWFLILEE